TPAAGLALLIAEPRIVEHGRAVAFGGTQGVEHESRIVVERVIVAHRSGQVSLREFEQHGHRLPARESARRREVPANAKQVVSFHADPQLPHWAALAAVRWKNETEWLRQVRRDAVQCLLFHTGFVDEPDSPLFQVT